MFYDRRMSIRRAVVWGVVMLSLVGSAFADRREELGTFSPEEIRATARELAARIKVPADKQADLWHRLDRALDDPSLAATRPPITGVIVYQRGGGGFLVKVQKARALARFKGRPKIATLKFDQVTYGGTIGGGTEYGVALVLDLADVAYFGGDYNGGTRGGTMGKASMSVTEVTKKGSAGTNAFHKLYLVGTGAGASADAGGAHLKMKLLGWVD